MVDEDKFIAIESFIQQQVTQGTNKHTLALTATQIKSICFTLPQ